MSFGIADVFCRKNPVHIEDYKELVVSLAYALYEVEFDVEVNLITGETKILKVDGRTLLDPEKEQDNV